MTQALRAAVALSLAVALVGSGGADAGSSTAPDLDQGRSTVERLGNAEVIATEQDPTDGGSSGDIAIRGERAVASWDVDEGTRYAWRTRRGWSGPKRVSDAWQGPVAVGPRGTMLVTWQAPRNAVSNGFGHLYARVRTSEGWSATQRLGGSSNGPVKLAIDASGAMTVAWSPNRNGVSVISRLADDGWGEATALRGGLYVNALDLASNRQGDAAVAWVGAAGIRSATRMNGLEWTIGPDLAADAFWPGTIELSLDEAGRMIALWGASTEEDSLRRRYLGWSTKPPGGDWSQARYLDARNRAEVYGTRQLALDVNTSGDAVAGWATEELRDYTSWVARFDVDAGTWTPPVDLERPDVSEALLRDSGTALVGLAESWERPRRFWWTQVPGESWQRRSMDVPRRSTTTLGIGGGSAAALIMGRVVAARFLDVP